MNGTWAQIAETSAARIYGLFAGLLSLFITARILGPEGQGILAAAVTSVRMFASFGGLEPWSGHATSLSGIEIGNLAHRRPGNDANFVVVVTLLACAVVLVIDWSNSGAFSGESLRPF